MRAVLLAFLLLSISAHARDSAQRAQFAKTVPCPATGKTSGKCPGYVVDHAIPLCMGGADAPINMRWQEYRESLRKDKTERAMCAWLRKQGIILP